MQNFLNIAKSPSLLLLYSGIIFFLFCLVLPGEFNGVLAFGIAMNKLIWIFAFFLIAFRVLYVFTERFLYSIIATWAHIVITLSSIFLIIIEIFMAIKPSQETGTGHELVGNTIQVLALVLIFSQVIYLVNLGLGFERKGKNS